METTRKEGVSISVASPVLVMSHSKPDIVSIYSVIIIDPCAFSRCHGQIASDHGRWGVVLHRRVPGATWY